MRRLPLLSLTTLMLAALACTRPNPAFDLVDETGADSDEDPTKDSDTADPSTGDPTGDPTGDGDGDAESSTGDGDADPPPDMGTEPLCPWWPSYGLAIELGSPADFGGQCPTGINATVAFVDGGAGEAVLAVCNAECGECDTELDLAAYPLLVANYFPNDPGFCMHVRAEFSLGSEPETCYWGALTLRDAFSGVPYVIATTHSAPPTEDALPDLAGLIPDPVKAGACSCDEIGFGDECCYQAPTPEFYYFPFDGQEIYPGGFADMQLPQWALSYYFKVFQAEKIGDCINEGVQLSWAVTAAL